ncbi:MAG: thymidine phosphorylase [Chloroflexi bacterium]|nr:thymidine phosphorylase [Chloroflexota bacterium]
MRAVDIITKKRDGGELTAAEIDFFVQGFTRGEIPDYQAAAWLMAVFFQGMSGRESIELTLSMARSGEMLDLSGIAPFVVDKHSSGGVGDKTTLVVAPLVASLGIPVGKISGRGLGFSGGTLDKLESIPGYRSGLTLDEFKRQLRQVGLVVAGQTASFTPADGKLYALRDVTGTVQSPPLIASSIMSKKIATGSNGIVLDVKVGQGAFMQTEAEAVALAELMVKIGRGVGRRVRAAISDMNQPLGRAVGNALELKEAIETLHGGGPEDFLEHCLVIGEQMVLLAGRAADETEARALLTASLKEERAWDKFRQWIAAQGGDVATVDNPQRLPQARWVEALPAPRSGTVASIDAMEVGLTAALLGGGRAKKGDALDYGVGIVLHVKVGDEVAEGEPLCTVHANSAERLAEARKRLLNAYTFSDEPVPPLPLIHQIIK